MFSSLKDEQLQQLENISSLHNYVEGETLFIKGEISQNIMILVDGIVSIYKHDDKGNEIVISYFNKYALLAEAATLRKTPLPSSAKFHSNGQILKINIDKFERVFMANSDISYAIIQSLLQKVELLQQNIHFNIASNSKNKIYEFYKHNTKLSLDLKQYEIASILGITPETLSRITKSLIKEQKLIKTSYGFKINKTN